jgi:hypothetical protein
VVMLVCVGARASRNVSRVSSRGAGLIGKDLLASSLDNGGAGRELRVISLLRLRRRQAASHHRRVGGVRRCLGAIAVDAGGRRVVKGGG